MVVCDGHKILVEKMRLVCNDVKGTETKMWKIVGVAVIILGGTFSLLWGGLGDIKESTDLGIKEIQKTVNDINIKQSELLVDFRNWKYNAPPQHEHTDDGIVIRHNNE